MKAVISGQAAVAVLVEDTDLSSIQARRPGKVVARRPEEIRFLLGDARDLEFVEDTDLQEVGRRLELATAKYDALHLALILLDESASHKTRRIAAEELERFLERAEIADFPEHVLFSHPLPRGADPSGARSCCTGRTPKTRRLLDRLDSWQVLIAEVHEAWERIPDSLFGSTGERSHALATAVREGLFRDLVSTLAARLEIESFYAGSLLNKGFQAVRNYRDILEEWTSSLCNLRREEGFWDTAFVRRAGAVAEKRFEDVRGFVDVAPVLGRAKALRVQGRHTDALGLYEKVLAESPGNVEARRGKGEVLQVLGYDGEVLAGGL